MLATKFENILCSFLFIKYIYLNDDKNTVVVVVGINDLYRKKYCDQSIDKYD